ncbi:MAG TPA: diguanylate cyclase [Telluria sp.]|nr:diguanylate cyclase [Telluria sp.]
MPALGSIPIPEARFRLFSGGYFRPAVLWRLGLWLAALIPTLGGIVAFQLSQLDEISERESARAVRNLAYALSQEVASGINTIDLSLRALRYDWLRDPRHFDDEVKAVLTNGAGGAVFQLAVTDPAGHLAYSNIAARPGLDLSDREHIQVQLASQGDRIFISRPLLGRISGRWSVQFSRPVRRPDGSLAGVIVASVEPSYFYRFYADIDLGQDASVSLARSDGTILGRSSQQGQAYVGRSLKGAPQFEPDAAPSGNFRRVGVLDGIERIYGWHTLEGSGLVVTVGQSIADAHGRYDRQRSWVWMARIGTGVALTLVVWLLLAAADNRRRALMHWASAEERWRLALKATGDGVWDCDMLGRTAQLSPRAQTILGVERAEIACLDEILDLLAHPRDADGVRAALQAHIAGARPDFESEFRIRRRDGSWAWVQARGRIVERGADGPRRMVGTFANIDARKAKEAHIRRLAQHDALTGLPNRLRLHDKLRQRIDEARRSGRPFAVLYFDLDGFKPVNDAHGHHVGDALLKLVAARMRAALRRHDLLARVGGDEFVALLPDVDARTAAGIGENVIAAFAQPFHTDGLSLPLGCSVGLALYPDHGTDPEQLLQHADAAMYAAKTSGRGQLICYTAPST